jgi:hypothetical protein
LGCSVFALRLRHLVDSGDGSQQRTGVLFVGFEGGVADAAGHLPEFEDCSGDADAA